MAEPMHPDFERVVREYQRPLYGFARRIMLNREDAEEVVQDAFVRAYRALGAMPANIRDGIRLSPWLHTITLNVARNRLRKKHFQLVSLDAMLAADRRVPSAPPEERPEAAVERQITRELLESAILEVPQVLRDTARLRILDGLTHAEIAQRFCEPVGTIQSRVFRALRLIRGILAAHHHAA